MHFPGAAGNNSVCSAFCCKLCGMCKSCRATCLLFSSEDGVRRGGSAGACSNRSRWCFVGETEEKKMWVNDYLLERTTKVSYIGLLTELSLEKEIFKEYLRKIVSQTLVNFGIHNFCKFLSLYAGSFTFHKVRVLCIWRDEGPAQLVCLGAQMALPNREQTTGNARAPPGGSFT